MAKKIKVGFSRGTKPSLVGRAIMKVMGTPYSHTYIYLNQSDEVFEAEFVGVRTIKYSDWIKDSFVVEEVDIEITDKRYEELLKFVAESKGKRYSVVQLLMILWAKLGGKVIYDNGDSIYICSELVARALSDILCIPDEELDLVTPLNIYQLVKALKASLLIEKEFIS